MNERDMLIIFYLHKLSYPDPNPATGAPWTTSERMADIFRQLRKARAISEKIPWAVLEPRPEDVAEVETEISSATK